MICDWRCWPVILSALLSTTGIGCAGSKQTRSAAARSVVAEAPSPADPIISAGSLGTPDGLELRWWVVRDEMDLILTALAPYLDRSVPADASTVERLRAMGLRLVAVPLTDLLPLRSSLPIIGRIDRRWIGQPTDWTSVIDGAPVTAGAPVRFAEERLALPAGRLRLLARSWTEISATHENLRLDLVIQHVPAQRPARAIGFGDAAARPRDAAEGLVFSASLAELSIPPDTMLLLIPDAPEEEWTGGEPSAEPTEEEHPSRAETGVDAHPAVGADVDEGAGEWSAEPVIDEAFLQGPPAPDVPTPGEALLMTHADGTGARRLRAVVAFVPRVARRRTLLP